MEILKRIFLPAAVPPFEADALRGGVLITDSNALADWGREHGLEVIRAECPRLGDERILNGLLARTEPCGNATVICAMGFDRDVCEQDFAEIGRYAEGAFAMIGRLLASRCALTLIGLRRQEAAAAGVLDGMALSARYETTRLHYASLIVDGPIDARLVTAIAAARAKPGLRYRFDGDSLWREALESFSPSASQEANAGLRQHGCYVVVGGAGGVGSLLSAWLARRYQANVCVIGRSDLDEARKARLKTGGVKCYAQADVTDFDALSAAMGHIKARHGAIDGVFHLAGVVDDRLIINKQRTDLARVLAPKIAGALNLWRLDPTVQPGFVCQFTSLSGLVGNVGQSDYAAANAFVDALTDHLAVNAARARPRWCAVNWGLWASTGMQVPAGQNDLIPLDADDACEALARILATALPLSVVFAGPRSVLGELADPGHTSVAAMLANTASSSMPALIDWIGEVVYKFSRLRDIATDASLVALGIDSAALISIVSAIEHRLAANGAEVLLNKAIIFDYPSIKALAGHLIQRYPQAIIAAFGDAAPAVDAQTIPGSRHVSSLARTLPTIAATAETSTADRKPVAADALQSLPPDAASTPAAHPASSDGYRADDIAIIGLAGEFPGADSVDELWTLLASDQDAITVIPGDRWSWQRDYSADQNRVASSYGRHGGFLRRAKQFDGGFFGITPVEAIKIDPQERRLLEIAYHALEDAGHFAEPNEDTGVFAAAMFGHYQNLDAETGPISSSFSSIANRISYFFNFQGPSLCVDSMCSGSLSALHLAINGLRNGDCRQALVGAVNVMPHPGKLRLLSAGRFLSPTGRCHSFGVEADGYVPGEGAIVVVIKPLRDAIASHDRIHGIIRASALNAGGRSSGFTVPSPRAQKKVIRQALARAGVDAADIDYVEAHGTGTSLGDPIEISALAAAYGRRDGAQRLVGSIKSNIGHLESAAGLAGLAKILLQFRHRTIAATRNCEIENPYLDLGSTGFRLPHQAESWNARCGTYLAGLSSFGAGGSNAHVIVQSYSPPQQDLPVLDHYLIPLSARTPRALAARVRALATWLDGHEDMSLYAVAYTLGVCREHFRHRTCFAVAFAADLKRQLADFDPSTAPATPAELDATQVALRDRYLAGDVVGFASLYRARAVASLPHYVFEDQEYWDPSIGGPQNETTAKDVRADDAFVAFQPAWQAAPVARHTRRDTPGCCVVICGARQALALARLPSIVTIVPAETFTLGERGSQVRPDSVDDVIAALRHHAPPGGPKPWLINLVDSTCSGEPQMLARFQFTLVKAIVATGAAYRMAFVYGDGHGRWPTPVGSAFVATFRVLSIEEAGFELISLEVGDAALGDAAGLVARAREELEFAEGTFLACRRAENERWITELRELALPAPSGCRFRRGGVYLITGGLGMIGIAVAKKLLATFNATVVLVGRTAPGASTESKLASLRHLGGRVEYMRADVSDRAEVTSLVTSILEEHGALHGVIHSAGILKDGLLRNKSLGDFESVLAAKIDAARNLDDATAAIALDFFVLFSSISGVFGHVGQGDYAAGNRYLDLFARARQREKMSGRRHGLTLSIDWPLWIDDSGTDMRKYRSLGLYLLDNYGMDALTLKRGASLLVRLIESASEEAPQIAPFVGDLDKIRKSLHTGILQATSTAVAASPRPQPAAPLRLAEMLRVLVVELTGLTHEDVGEHTSFGDLGLSSVNLQQLAVRLEACCGLAIPPSAFFSYNTIEQLASHLSARGARVDDAAVEAAPPITAAITTSSPRPSVVAHSMDRRVAIIGIDGRLPGGIDLAEFWEGLVANRSAIKQIERWPHAKHFGGTIPQIEQFDAKFFGLSGREAMLMDPQHRLFLQACYNAVLDAGYAPRSLARMGVFAGVQFSDYQTLLQMSGQGNHPYAATGNAHAMLANRVSYLFDFGGPSQTIDTACSSSLVAVNRAVLSLNAGECDHAIVGAVSLLIDSAMTDAAQSMGVLSPHHRCATFDADADGYVRGEGVGCLLLKRYADAERDGDSIYAVIEATAENHGGRANSLTAPNPAAQQRLLLSAYSPELAQRVSYIETHGTGTKLGDPVEIDALKNAWRTLVPEPETSPVLLGSVKTNIGHLEPAAGIASMLKVILALKHRVLPANVHFKCLNPYIDLDGSRFQILTANKVWEGHGRVAGISSFGFGGANAHVVLSDPPERVEAPWREPEAHLIVLSAKTPRSLMQMKAALLRHLLSPEGEKLRLADIATTLGEGRDNFEHRLAWVVSDVAQLVDALRTVDVGQIRHVTRPARPGRDQAAGPSGHAGEGDPVASRARYLDGVEPDWARLRGGARGRRIHLPTYAFDTRAFWFEDMQQAIPSDEKKQSTPTLLEESSNAMLVEESSNATATKVEAWAGAKTGPGAVDLAANPAAMRNGDADGRLAPEKIVIVGAACRFPGSESLEVYWQNLLEGSSCATEVDRWAMPDTVRMRGGFLDDIAHFDAGFFRISPNEARCMDPQHRVLMEVAHHAMEDSGLPVATLRQMRCGVFCTSLPGDYKFVIAQDHERAFSSQSFVGNATSSLSGRISYFYDFNGPSITLDTACSSSLTALQIACLQLQSSACDAALVGAVSIFSTSELFQFARRTNMLSVQGRCSTFGEQADGFVPSEGAAAVVLMTESKALALGLDILATIEAIGLNHGGQSNGLMAPNGRAQAELIEEVYRRAGIPVGAVGYVEAHGTGTKLGDPVELAALSRAFRARDASYTAYLGASKSVIGHTLVCSGLASVLKTMLILRHGTIPGHPIAGPISTQLDLDRFVVNTEAVAWPADKSFAAVSAFGFTGSNGHVVLGRAPGRATETFQHDGAYPFLFSAQTPISLQAKLGQFQRLIDVLPEQLLGSLSVALGKGTEDHRLRVALGASTRNQLSAALTDLLARPAANLGPAVCDIRGIADATVGAGVAKWLDGNGVHLYDRAVVARTPRIDLPKYPFDRRPYWVGEMPAVKCDGGPKLSGAGAAEILSQLKAKLAELLGFDDREIDVARPVRDYGIDSISVIQLLAQFGRAAAELHPQDIFNYTSIEAFAADLARRAAGSGAAAPTQRSGTIIAAAKSDVQRKPLLQWCQPARQQGRPAVLLPPLNMSHEAWTQQIAFLRRHGYAPHIPIYPGHLENRLSGQTLDQEALVDEIIDHIRGELSGAPALMLGWSLGGCFSLAVAAKCPQLISAMVLVSTAARFDDDVFGKTIDLHRELEANADYLDIVLKPGSNIVEQVGAGATMDVLRLYYGMLADFNMVDALPRIPVKTLIVHGRRDLVVGDADVALLRSIPNATIVEFEDQGHFIPLTAPRRFNDRARQFLAEEVER